MAKTILREVAKESKLVKVVVTYSYWQSWQLFDETFRRSQTLLRRSVIGDRPYFKRRYFWRRTLKPQKLGI